MPKNVAFYISDPSMIGSRLFDKIESIESYKPFSKNNDAAGFLLKMPWGQMDVDIMPSGDLPNHLEGYIRSQKLSKDEVEDILVGFNSHLNGFRDRRTEKSAANY